MKIIPDDRWKHWQVCQKHNCITCPIKPCEYRKEGRI